MKIKDTKKTNNKQDIFSNLLSPNIIPKDKLIYINAWGKKVKSPEIILSIKGIPLLTSGSWMLLKAEAKAGKTSHLECICASWIADVGNTIGWKTQLFGKTKILLIDTEQGEHESQQSYNRIMRRCGFDMESPEPPDEALRLIHIGLKRYNEDEMISKITEILSKNPEIGLVLIDVASDLAPDSVMNDSGLKPLQTFLNSISEELGVVVTIHVNENSQLSGNLSARGHIGKYFERKCTSIISLKNETDNTYSLMVERNRIGSNSKLNPIYYSYNTELDMFTETDYTPIKTKEKEEYYKNLIEEIMQGKTEKPYSEIVELLIKKTGKTKGACEAIFSRNIKNLMEKTNIGYKLS
jgi:uncharacterized protein YrzB (UPF0473 family)